MRAQNRAASNKLTNKFYDKLYEIQRAYATMLVVLTNQEIYNTWHKITTPPHLAIYTSIFTCNTCLNAPLYLLLYPLYSLQWPDFSYTLICLWLTDLLLCFCCVVKTIVLMRAIIVPDLTILSTISKPKPITYNNNKLTGDLVCVFLSEIVSNMYLRSLLGCIRVIKSLLRNNRVRIDNYENAIMKKLSEVGNKLCVFSTRL